MNIRRAKQRDLPIIAAVQAESWRDTYSDVLPETHLANQIVEDIKRHWNEVEIKPNDVVLVAEDDGIIGFIAVWCRPEPFIDNLHVKPSKRSQRVGSTLMMSAAQQLIQQGHKTAHLWVVESNQRAIRLYERLGGVRTGRALKNLFGHDVPSVKIEWSDIAVLCKQE
jgi:ribosomal protein S18 acetylase RimI-like enzyme